MRPTQRGGPGDFHTRLARADLAPPPGTEGPMRLLREIIRHQMSRVDDPLVQKATEELVAGAMEPLVADGSPMLRLTRILGPLLTEVDLSVARLATNPETVPEPLGEAGLEFVDWPPDDQGNLVRAWINGDSYVDPRVAFWLRVSAAPMLELAAERTPLPSRELWGLAFCPLCGGAPQVSVIAEETGEFMAGSPRYLVCERCAGWWTFPRAVCAICGEDDSTKLESHTADGRTWVRIDSCDSCHGYVKTFDLRAADARDVVPLVDDVATITLDLWAHDRGLHRLDLTSAGV